jgi:hypothetical protein
MEQTSEHVYYIADENKLSVVSEYTHFQFVDFILEKSKRESVLEDEYSDLVASHYKDIIYLGEL